jgi:outer membrane protein
MRWLLLAIFGIAFGPVLAQESGESLFNLQTQTEKSNDVGKALWEIGVAAGGLYSPEYPGSDKYALNSLAVPYVIYRGKILRLGDGNLAKGIFFEGKNTQFDISLDASFNADSNKTSARYGMPDLDYLVEIGPQLTFKLGESFGGKIQLLLPLRASFVTDFDRIRHQGYVFGPVLSYTRKRIIADTDFFSSIGARFATEEYHDYFYQIDAPFATISRPRYEATGGYLGSQTKFRFITDVTNRISLVLGGEFAYYGGAANRGSPLHRDRFGSAITIGFTLSGYESNRRSVP